MTLYQSGLAIMRAQPPHIGHIKLIRRMLRECQNVVIILGSVQEQGTERNPYSYIQRKEMLQKIFVAKPETKRLKILGMFDINNPTQWGVFVMDFLKEACPNEPLPEVYYAGSEYDAQWFRDIFANIQIENRVDYGFPYVSGSMVRDMIKIGDKRWHDFVPQEIHKMIEDLIPTEKGVC